MQMAIRNSNGTILMNECQSQKQDCDVRVDEESTGERLVTRQTFLFQSTDGFDHRDIEFL